MLSCKYFSFIVKKVITFVELNPSRFRGARDARPWRSYHTTSEHKIRRKSEKKITNKNKLINISHVIRRESKGVCSFKYPVIQTGRNALGRD